MTQEVLDRVENLTREEGQVKLIDRMPLFEWEDGKKVEGIYEASEFEQELIPHRGGGLNNRLS